MKTSERFVGGDLPLAFADMSPEVLGSTPQQRGMVAVDHLILGRFVTTMVTALSSDDPYSELAACFDAFQPATAAEVVGVTPRLPWHDEPALHYALPWDSSAPGARWKTRRQSLMAREAEAAGFSDWLPEYGWKGFGPATPQLVEVEAGRLIRVRDLIAKNGFSLPDAPGATPFLAGDQVRFRPRVGFHRLAAAISLGFTALPVTASWRNTVKLADAATWENVTNGSYTLDEAVTVFADTLWNRGV